MNEQERNEAIARVEAEAVGIRARIDEEAEKGAAHRIGRNADIHGLRRIAHRAEAAAWAACAAAVVAALGVGWLLYGG